MLTGLNLWACERQGPPDLFGNLHYNNHTISTHFSLSPQCRGFNTSVCDVSDLQEKMLKWCHVWKPCLSFMSHLFEYSQIKPELILQTFLHSPLHFLGLSASSQCGYYERSRNPSYCKPANTVTLYSIQAQHNSNLTHILLPGGEKPISRFCIWACTPAPMKCLLLCSIFSDWLQVTSQRPTIQHLGESRCPRVSTGEVRVSSLPDLPGSTVTVESS